jgi:hypothetical protein
VALALSPADAEAGVGFSSYIQHYEFTTETGYASPFSLPTIDYHSGAHVIQFHALELIAGALNGNDETEDTSSDGGAGAGDGAGGGVGTRTAVDYPVSTGAAHTNSFNLGVNYYYTVDNKKVTDMVDGVFQPGVSIDIVKYMGDEDDGTSEDLYSFISFQARAGAQGVKKYGFGFYVVPAIGFASVPDPHDADFDNHMELVVGGSFQASVWAK